MRFTPLFVTALQTFLLFKIRECFDQAPGSGFY
jgi:hypothetical protein